MNKKQAVALLTLIADLVIIISAPEPPKVEVKDE